MLGFRARRTVSAGEDDCQLAGLLVVGPVVGRVVGDVQDLLAKREVVADFPRAHKILTKVGVG
jgi:hypothetical protein